MAGRLFCFAIDFDDTGPLPLGGSHGVVSIVESHGCVWKWESSINPPILQFYSFDRENAD